MSLPSRVEVRIEKPQVELPSPTKLPPGPGNNWVDAAFRQDHRKRQLLANEFAGAVPKTYSAVYVRPRIETPAAQTEAGRELMTALQLTQEGRAMELVSPPAMTLDDKILLFHGFFVEPVAESGVETERVRPVTLTCFPLDDTVLLQEPRVANSGMQGGVMLKRQRVPLDRRDAARRAEPRTDGSRFPDLSTVKESWVSINDIEIGGSVWLHGRQVFITDCDDATRRLLVTLGRTVPAGMQILEDAFSRLMVAKRLEALRLEGKTFASRDLAITMESLHSGKPCARYPDELKRVQRFLADSGKMLRFYVYWHDEEAAPPRVRTFDLRYFLEDDTISFVEHHLDNVEQAKNFLSRRRLPKSADHSKAVELTFAGRINGTREVYLGKGETYYAAADFAVGITINVYGRPFFVYDADQCTREYFARTLGRPLAEAVDVNHLFPVKSTKRLPLPPPTGFGSEEDSEASCRGLVLKAPKKMAPDPELQGKSLRYELRFHKPDRQEDLMRRFLLTFYLEDDQIMIAEVPIRNTGYTGGRFLRRQRLRKPGCPVGNDRASFFNLEDISVGAVLNVNGFRFEVIDADERSTQYVAHKETLGRKPEDLTRVHLPRLQELLTAFQAFVTCRYPTNTEAFRALDADHNGRIDVSELEMALVHNQITSKEEEIVGVMQQLDRKGNGFIEYADFFAAMQSPLQVRLPSPSHGAEAIDIVADRDIAATLADGNRRNSVRDRVLKSVKERLEGRCLNGFEMFRMISTQPRALRDKRADMASLTNGAKDVVFTPVQLRRTVLEHLGLMLDDNEMAALLGFFFPNLPRDEYKSTADTSTIHGVDLRTFQAKFIEMSSVRQLK